MPILMIAFLALAFISSAFGAEPKRDIFGFALGMSRDQVMSVAKSRSATCRALDQSPQDTLICTGLRSDVYIEFTLVDKPERLVNIETSFESTEFPFAVISSLKKQFSLAEPSYDSDISDKRIFGNKRTVRWSITDKKEFLSITFSEGKCGCHLQLEDETSKQAEATKRYESDFSKRRTPKF